MRSRDERVSRLDMEYGGRGNSYKLPLQHGASVASLCSPEPATAGSSALGLSYITDVTEAHEESAPPDGELADERFEEVARSDVSGVGSYKPPQAVCQLTFCIVF